MKDIDRPGKGSKRAQEAQHHSEIDSIAAMTQDEVLFDLRRHDIKPTKELPQQLRQFLNTQPPLRAFEGVNPSHTSRDDRLYTFLVTHTSRSRAEIRRICIHKRWLKVAPLMAALILCAAAYGLIGVYREAAHLRVEQENARLRIENEIQKRNLEQLKDRVDAVEDASRRLAEISGMPEQSGGRSSLARGGPQLKMSAGDIAAFEQHTAELERQLEQYKRLKHDPARVPSIWPVVGEVTDDFGGRRDPFGGGELEFHPALDIAAPGGTPVIATADGIVMEAGYKNAYGILVVLDHGNGLTTRYGHLSKIEVAAGQVVRRGEELGQVGSTGRSTGPELHYEVRFDDMPVNPKRYLPKTTH